LTGTLACSGNSCPLYRRITIAFARDRSPGVNRAS